MILDFDLPHLATPASRLRRAVERGERLERELAGDPDNEDLRAELELAQLDAEQATRALSGARVMLSRERERERAGPMPSLTKDAKGALDDPPVRLAARAWLEGCEAMKQAWQRNDGPAGDVARRQLGQAKRALDLLVGEQMGAAIRKAVERREVGLGHVKDDPVATAAAVARDVQQNERERVDGPRVEKMPIVEKTKTCPSCRSRHGNDGEICDACEEKKWITVPPSGARLVEPGELEDAQEEDDDEGEAEEEDVATATKEGRTRARLNVQQFTDEQLVNLRKRGMSTKDIARNFKVTTSAIYAREKKLREQGVEIPTPEKAEKPSKPARTPRVQRDPKPAIQAEAEASVALDQGDVHTRYDGHCSPPGELTKKVEEARASAAQNEVPEHLDRALKTSFALGVSAILTKPTATPVDPEAHAIAVTVEAIRALDDGARARVWGYLRARFGT